MASGAPSTNANTGVPPVDDWLADIGSGAAVAASRAAAVPDLHAR
jgi:hypothetical protein